MTRVRRSNAEVKTARAQVVANKERVIQAYYGGTTKLEICRTWGVDDRWLKKQFGTWKVHERSRSEINKLSAPKGPRRRTKQTRARPS